MIASNQPGSEHMSTRVCTLDHIGAIGPHVLNVLKHELVDPIARKLFPEVCTSDRKDVAEVSGKYPFAKATATTATGRARTQTEVCSAN